VECAAIATRYLGVSFDVQAGGTDLIYPHHEMSASHARVAAGPGGGGSEGAGAGGGGSGGGGSGCGGEPGRPVFARRYAHAGMVRLGGEKMSKSLGNLVFVSKLTAAGVDPMAIRLAILAHHYRTDWDWTDEGLAAAKERLTTWRAAVSRASSGPASSPAAEEVLAEIRERIADDLDAPGALAAVDDWAGAVLVSGDDAGGDGGGGDGGGGGPLVRDAVDAILGIALWPRSHRGRAPIRRSAMNV
jgi:L-cysteine:1D-myo-inositol 2-amino-2-deoxy-alpha-D-glucopyranoside ligase